MCNVIAIFRAKMKTQIDNLFDKWMWMHIQQRRMPLNFQSNLLYESEAYVH